MKVQIVTNNPMTAQLKLEEGWEMVYLEKSVQELLAHCSELLMLGKWTFLTDFMGGRRARPFPYLTILLKEAVNEEEITDKNWQQLVDYQMLDSKRQSAYAGFEQPLLDDYQVLDSSLTKNVLKKLS